MTAIKDRIQQFGLTEVYCSPEPLVDVVFVHGLNGNPYKTWATQKPDVYWPADLLPESVEDQHCRILTYGYDANVTAFTDGTSKDHIHNHAEHLAARLVANRSVKARERPIIFIAHSLGGLVVKRLLIYCESINNPKLERLRSIYVSTFGILFLGTPHNGSDLAKWGSLLQSICSVALPKKILDTSPQLVNALKSNNETLQNINRLFIEILDPFRIYFFHESKPTDLKGTMQFIVDEDSAAPVMQGVERMGIERDHSHMCKFEDVNAPGYDVVADAVSSYAEEAPGKVKGRWEREKHVREYHRQSIASELLGVFCRSGQYKRRTTLLEKAGELQWVRAPHQCFYWGDLLKIHTRLKNMTSSKTFQFPPDAELLVSPPVSVPGTNSLRLAESSVQSVKMLEASASASQSSKQTPRVAPLLFRPNSVFVGFDIELARLERKLQAEEKKKIGTCPVLICGPPGSGKSHLAREYVWTHQTDYPAGIFWVDCKSKENTVRYYWDIGQALGCLDGDHSNTFQSDKSFVAEVRKRLESLQGWLIVFDGIFFSSDESMSDFVRYIPDSPGNCIIYTSVDPTLKRRHRLLNPSSIRLLPLRPDAACELLFKSMGIHKHTAAQRQKAEELVQYYGCLPLGIHAAAHMLRAQGRVLEKFSPVASDQRLLNPFLEILRALEREGHLEAITLLGLLSMLNHKVPVALLNFGTAAVEEAGLDIRSLEPGGGVRRDLDNSISILLKYGVVERELQTYSVSTSEQSRTSPTISRTATTTHFLYSSPLVTPQPSQTTEDSTGLEFMVDEAKDSSGSVVSISITIDTLRTHTVTQSVILEEIKTRGLNRMSYEQWRILACQFLCGSYEFASKRFKSLPGQGSVADYREYKAHATLLWKLLPRSHKQASVSLTKARNELLGVIRDIQREIHARSPSHSQSSHDDRFRILGSVFENSASSSDEGAHTPSSDITRASTWSSGKFDFRNESPTHFMGSRHADNEEAISDLDDEGYTTEYDDLHSNIHVSQRWGVNSDTTAVPLYSVDVSPRPSFLHAMLPYSGKRDLGELKPVPVVGVSNPEVRPTRPRSTSSSITSFSWPFRRGSATQSAEEALAAVQAKTPLSAGQPPDSRKTSSSSESRERPKLLPSKQPLGEKSTNTFLPIAMGASSHSPPDMLPKPRQASIQHTGPALTSAKFIHATRERQAVLTHGDIHTEDMSDLQEHPRVHCTGATSSSTGVHQPPEPVPPACSSLPMSRDHSHESTYSLASAPTNPFQADSRAISDHLETYEFPKRVLPSIDRFLRHSVDLGHSGGWTYPSLSTSIEDDTTREFDLADSASRTVPTSPSIGLQYDRRHNEFSEARKHDKGKEKEGTDLRG